MTILGIQPLTQEASSVVASLEDRCLVVKLSGTFDMAAAVKLQQYFDQVQAEARRLQVLEILLDVVEVYYLGSSCIKAFVRLTAGLQHGTGGMLLRLKTNPRLDWQTRAFQVLSRMSPNRVVVQG